MRAQSETLKKMEEFDALIKGLSNIFDPETNIFDLKASIGMFDTESYTDIGDGVHCRRLKNKTDIRDEREKKARNILNGIDTKKQETYLMFCEFKPGGFMRLHAHPQKEFCFLFEGSLRGREDDSKFLPGQVAVYDRLSKHEPYSDEGCFLLVVWFGA